MGGHAMGWCGLGKHPGSVHGVVTCKDAIVPSERRPAARVLRLATDGQRHTARGRARPGRTARIERCSAVCAMIRTRAPMGLGGVPPTRPPHTLRRPCAAARSGEIVETCRRSSVGTNTSPTTFDKRTQIVTFDNPASSLPTTCARDDGNPKKRRSRFDILATSSRPVADGLGAKIIELGEGSHASCAGSRSVGPSPIPAGGTSPGTRSTSCRGAAPRGSGSPTTGSPR